MPTVATPSSLECDTNDCEVMAWVSDCVFSAEAYSSVGEEVDDHRQSPPSCQGGSVPLLHQAIKRSGIPPESSQHGPGDGGQEQRKHHQSPEE